MRFEFSLAGKRALITGASRGIGRATAEALAAHGADMVLSGRNETELEEVAAEIRALGRQVHVVPADLMDTESAAALPTRAAERLGGLDILINNAGGAGAYVPGSSGGLFDVTNEAYEGLFRLNLASAYAVTAAAAQIMKDQGSGGSIVNNTSIQGIAPTGNLGAYASVKAGLQALTVAWAQELGPFQIRVNAVAPGGVVSENLARLIKDPEARREREAKIPLGWLAEPRDAAACMLFLAADEARWVSGATILLSGGRPG
jgi:7-alpha-hydroxysteroid dehydrogenase